MQWGAHSCRGCDIWVTFPLKSLAVDFLTCWGRGSNRGCLRALLLLLWHVECSISSLSRKGKQKYIGGYFFKSQNLLCNLLIEVFYLSYGNFKPNFSYLKLQVIENPIQIGLNQWRRGFGSEICWHRAGPVNQSTKHFTFQPPKTQERGQFPVKDVTVGRWGKYLPRKGEG